MSVSALSASNQNYLKAIWCLGEWSKDPVTPSKIAARVGVKLSTASDAIRTLTKQGLVEHAPYGAVTLSDTGREYALTMVRRHRLLETFLVEIVGYRWDQVHEEAEILEHAVSEFMLAQIDELLGYPRRDPHGDLIPRADGSMDGSTAIALTTIMSKISPQGNRLSQRVRVDRISDDDPARLRYFADHGIVCGVVIEVQPGTPHSDAFDVVVEGTTSSVILGTSAMQAIWVTRTV